MKIGDLVLSKAYQNHANIVPAKLVVQVTARTTARGSYGPYIVLEDEPDDWKPARNFFVVSRA